MSKKKKQKDLTKSTHRMVKIGFIAGTVILGLGVAGGVAGIIGRNLVQQKKAEVYSVSFDLSGDMTKGKRLDAAVGMKAGINGAQNDFDHAYPWAAIRQVTDENGDVFTRIPRFYERYEIKENVMTYSITSEPRKGFKTNVAFIQGEKEIPYIDIGSYEASIDKKGKLRSVSGVMPETTGHTLDQYRDLAESSGNQLFDARGNQALQSLFLVEFATFDSQAIMAGETQYLSYVHEITAEDLEAETVKEFTVEEDEAMFILEDVDSIEFANANKKHLEVSYSYEDEDENYIEVKENINAKSIVVDEDEDTVTIELEKAIDITKISEGEVICLSFGSYSYHKTGSTDGKKGSSVGKSAAALETVAMNYRGVENWYGNTYTWCDGLATFLDSEEEQEYICVSLDATKNGDRDSYERYAVEDMDATLFTESGFNLFKFGDSNEGREFDYFYFSFAEDTYRIGGVGGSCGDSASVGAFCVNVSDVVSYASYSVRLSCIPQAQ